MLSKQKTQYYRLLLKNTQAIIYKQLDILVGKA